MHDIIDVAGLQDTEVRKAFQRSLTKQGFKFKLNTKVNSAEITGDKVKLDLETKKGDKETLEADVVLVSAGLFSSFCCCASSSICLLQPAHAVQVLTCSKCLCMAATADCGIVTY